MKLGIVEIPAPCPFLGTAHAYICQQKEVLMRAFAVALLLSIGSAGTAFAQNANTQSTQEEAAPAVKHFDFEDDLVEGDLQRPDGELVTSIPKATQPSLIELRWGFLREIIEDFENL